MELARVRLWLTARQSHAAGAFHSNAAEMQNIGGAWTVKGLLPGACAHPPRPDSKTKLLLLRRLLQDYYWSLGRLRYAVGVTLNKL